MNTKSNAVWQPRSEMRRALNLKCFSPSKRARACDESLSKIESKVSQSQLILNGETNGRQYFSFLDIYAFTHLAGAKLEIC